MNDSLAHLAVVTLVACGNSTATVERYAPCTSADVCPSSTVCESPADTIPTLCTHSCTSTDDCPSDPSARPVVCSTGFGADPFGFCVLDCTSAACPPNEHCTTMYDAYETAFNACVPGLADSGAE
jgi:hypothetical protein